MLDIVRTIILVFLGYIGVYSIIDRVCRCIERVATLKGVDGYTKNI